MSANLAAFLPATAARHPERTAIRLADITVSYAQLDEGSARVAGLLQERGIRRGDRVAVMLPNVPQFALAYYGVLRLGAIVVPMNVLNKRREVAFGRATPGRGWSSPWRDSTSTPPRERPTRARSASPSRSARSRRRLRRPSRCTTS